MKLGLHFLFRETGVKQEGLEVALVRKTQKRPSRTPIFDWRGGG